MTISEFLLARITEGEGLVERGIVWDADRALAECSAKRRIVEEHPGVFLPKHHEQLPPKCRRCRNLEPAEGDRHMFAPWPCGTLRALASVYADHPDYQQEWTL